MESELKRVAIIQTGKVLALLYGIAALIFVPIFLVGALANPREGAPMLVMPLFMLVFYPVMGFVGGILMAAIYNLVARLCGGFRFTIVPTNPPPFPPPPPANF